jgi:hypothetical protein
VREGSTVGNINSIALWYRTLLHYGIGNTFVLVSSQINFQKHIAETNGATAVLSYRVRAAPSTPCGSNHWNEIEVIARPSHWHIGDAAELVRSAGSKALANRGKRRRRSLR